MKTAGALLTIGEVSAAVGVPQHILRYWETRFTQLRPITRAGNRRYYRPEDVALVRRIAQALSERGHTIKGVQKLLDGAEPGDTAAADVPATDAVELAALIAVRDQLRAALAA